MHKNNSNRKRLTRRSILSEPTNGKIWAGFKKKNSIIKTKFMLFVSYYTDKSRRKMMVRRVACT